MWSCPCASPLRCLPPGSKPTAAIEDRRATIQILKSAIGNSASSVGGPFERTRMFCDVRSRNVYENNQSADKTPCQMSNLCTEMTRILRKLTAIPGRIGSIQGFPERIWTGQIVDFRQLEHARTGGGRPRGRARMVNLHLKATICMNMKGLTENSRDMLKIVCL